MWNLILLLKYAILSMWLWIVLVCLTKMYLKTVVQLLWLCIIIEIM